MNTVTDLRTELDTLADRAPSDTDVRRSLASRIERHAKRRRTTALIAAAAAVVVLAGGAGITGAVLSHRSAGPAAPEPVVQVPDVPLPKDTKLIRHQLQAVTSPVTATPPQGLTGLLWMSTPGRLGVDWFDPAAAGEPMLIETSDGATSGGGPGAAGYVITDHRDETLQSFGPKGPNSPTVTRKKITVGGHAATLDTAPDGTTDELGMPAEKRITWQLDDGRWIHVWWGEGRPSDDALTSFAAGITQEPQTLDRTIGIGLTLPGLTVDSSINSSPLASAIGANLYLCPTGVDPFVPSSGSSSGSGSSPAPTSASIAPNGSASSTSTETETDPTSGCIIAAVLNSAPQRYGSSSAPATTVTVGSTVAHVDTADGIAWSDLGNGLTALARAPQSAHLSTADLAALVASVRLSPAVTVLPVQLPQGQARGTGGVLSGSAVPTAAPTTESLPSPTAAGAPVTDRSAVASSQVAREKSAEESLASAAESARLSALSAAESARSSAQSAAESAHRAVVGALSSEPQAPPPTRQTVLGPSSGSLVHSAPIRFSVPFSLSAPAGDTVDVHWTISSDGGLVTLSFPDRTYEVDGKQGTHGGSIHYDLSGLNGVPDSASTITVNGHHARLWDAGTRIGWSLPDGSGVTVSGDDDATARLVAAMVGDHGGEVAVDAAPTLLPASLQPARLEATARPAEPMSLSAQKALALVLCPKGTPAGSVIDSPDCLEVSRQPGAAAGGTLPPDMGSWRVTEVDGATVYVSPDGRAVATQSTDLALLTVIAGSDVPVTAADLAAILLSTPH